MAKFFLFLFGLIFSMIGIRLVTYKTQNHDADMVLKIIGWIILPFAAYIVLESLRIIKWGSLL